MLAESLSIGDGIASAAWALATAAMFWVIFKYRD